jgi:repressor LexA
MVGQTGSSGFKSEDVMLTKKQHELLVFIHEHLERTGFSPSFDEMKIGLDLKSKSGIHRLITALEERGFLRRRAHRARALEVVRLPGNSNFVPETQDTENGRNVVHGQFGPKSKSPQRDIISLPLFGKIAAGSPIESIRDNGSVVDVPASMLSSGEHYALEVSGSSMIDAGILDGDTVLIQRGDAAQNGSIIVALIDQNEVTLKRLRRRGNSIALEPANKLYETRIFGPDRVQIQGRLVGLLRQY